MQIIKSINGAFYQIIYIYYKISIIRIDIINYELKPEEHLKGRKQEAQVEPKKSMCEGGRGPQDV